MFNLLIGFAAGCVVTVLVPWVYGFTKREIGLLGNDITGK